MRSHLGKAFCTSVIFLMHAKDAYSPTCHQTKYWEKESFRPSSYSACPGLCIGFSTASGFCCGHLLCPPVLNCYRRKAEPAFFFRNSWTLLSFYIVVRSCAEKQSQKPCWLGLKAFCSFRFLRCQSRLSHGFGAQRRYATGASVPPH